MRKKKNMRNKICWIVPLAIFMAIICSCETGKNPLDRSESSIILIPEDQVRLSNDAEKTEIFRDVGLGLFIHWGPNSQIGSEISWPLSNASEEFIDKYYALAETFNPVSFDAFEWARLAKLAGLEYKAMWRSY